MSYNKYDYGYTLQTDYNVVGGPALSGTVTMTLEQFEELHEEFINFLSKYTFISIFKIGRY